MRILVSSALFASTLVSVADGIAANALFSGANTVMPFAELSVSTRFAFLTAVTRVDSTGLFDAAVATGAVDMPVKLPAPEAGTAEQAGPNGFDASARTGWAWRTRRTRTGCPTLSWPRCRWNRTRRRRARDQRS